MANITEQIEQIRNELQKHGNTKGRVADALAALLAEIENLNLANALSLEIGTITTGEPGTAARVVNTGTPEHVVLSFTIPRGDKGEQGAAIHISPDDTFPGNVGNNGDLLIHAISNDVFQLKKGIWEYVGNIKGKQGETGKQGLQGKTGLSGIIEIDSVVTGEPGTQAQVENIGTPEHALLRFTIPAGAPATAGLVYEFSNSDNVPIVHGLSRYPGAIAMDNEGNVIEAEVVHISENELKINFNSTTSGKIIIN